MRDGYAKAECNNGVTSFDLRRYENALWSLWDGGVVPLTGAQFSLLIIPRPRVTFDPMLGLKYMSRFHVNEDVRKALGKAKILTAAY